MRSKLVWRISGIVLFVSLAFPSIGRAGEVCFSGEDAQRMVVDLEKGRNLQEQVELYRKATAELEQQIALLKEIDSLRKQQIEAGQTAIRQMQEIVSLQGKAYEEALQASRPSFLKKAIDALGLIGIGILAGALL